MRKILCFFFILFYSLYSIAQYPDWKSYTNGIEINALAKEGNYIWVGTTGGLVRIDKITGAKTVYTKENSGIPSVDVRAIAIDAGGNKWIGTWYGGLAKFDGASWTTYNTSNSPITCDMITDLCFDRNNNLWIGQGFGLDRLSGSTWTRFDNSNSPIPNNLTSVRSLACDSIGNLFVGIENDGLGKYDGTTWKVFTPSNSGIQNNIIMDIAVDTNNVVWAVAPYCNGLGGLIKLVDTTFTVYLSGVPIENLSIDQQNNIWSSGPGFLRKFNGTAFSYYNSGNSQITDMTMYSHVLADGSNIWYETDPFQEVRKFDGAYFVTNYNSSAYNMTSNKITSVSVDQQNNAWLAFGIYNPFLGVDVFDQVSFTNFNSSNSSIPTDSIIDIAIDSHNTIWMGTYSSGIIKYDGITWQLFDSLTYNLPSNCIQKNSIAFDTSGNVWVAFWPVIDSLGQLHGGGIAKYNGVSWTTVVQSDTIPNHNIDAIAIDHQNNLWATCYGKILKYDGNTWTEFNHSNSSFTLNGFRSMTVDANNSIWVGSDLFYPHNELIKISNSVLTVYTNLNSNLPSGVISSLSVDANNQLWIGLEAGDTGLSKLSGNTFTSYNINNSGLSTDYVYSVYAKGNKIYLGTEDGLLIYEDNSITGFNLVSTSAKSNLSVYPSPTHNTFSIFLNNEMQNAELKVFDIRGSEVYKQKLKGQSTIINNQFSPGVYFVRVSDGEKSFTQKLIVE